METVYLVTLITSLILVLSTRASEVCEDLPTITTSEAWNSCIGKSYTHANFTEIFRLATWERICRAAASLDKCISDEFSRCNGTAKEYLTKDAKAFMLNPGKVVWYPSSADVIISEVCQGDEVKNELSSMLSLPTMSHCVDAELGASITECAQDWLAEMNAVRNTGFQQLGHDRQMSLHRFARSTFACVLSSVWLHPNCLEDVSKGLMYALNLTLPEQMRSHFTFEKIGTPLTELDTLSTVRDTVGVWGDPHLLVHDVISPVTCSSEGRHKVYLSNPLVEIYGDNEKVRASNATILTKLKVFFKRNGPEYGRYVTEPGDLPSHFYGLTEHTPLGKNRFMIDITTIEDGRKILLNSTARAFQMLIQRRDSEYFFSLRVGRGVLESSGGLLVTGCSYRTGDVLNTSSVISGEDRKNSVSRSDTDPECEDACASLNTTSGLLDLGLLRQACLYDCKIMGDVKYAEIARSIVADMEELVVRDDELTLTAPDVSPVVSSSGQASSIISMATYLVTLTLVLIGRL